MSSLAMDAPDRLHFLSHAADSASALGSLVPSLARWFQEKYPAPTLPQRLAWPVIGRGENLLLAAPTGSGKTLAAFLPILQQLLEPTDQTGLQCLYVAPLKALVRDVRKNLRRCLRELPPFLSPGQRLPRIGLRTGETSYRVRKRQLEDPPDILLTTPESLAVMLTQPAALEMFRTLRWVVIDEIHALAPTKRGADLSLSLERLEELVSRERERPEKPADPPSLTLPALKKNLQRIGLSATCAPLATAARFLVGANRPCTVAQVQDAAPLHITIEPLSDETPGRRQGFLARLLDRLAPLLEDQPTTLIFTNTRNLAERLTWALRKRYPDWKDQIGVHHSALAAARRRSVERRLKHGRLRVVVSSTSLELGIDIGSVDLVVLVHPPGGVVRLLQRVGRAGHRPHQPRTGLVLTSSSTELLEATVTASSSRLGQIETLQIPPAPRDVLCQHLLGMAIGRAWTPPEALDLIRRAYPYRHLSLEDFQVCMAYLFGLNAAGESWLPARLARHGENFAIINEQTARLVRRNLGTILTEERRTIRLLESGSPEDRLGGDGFPEARSMILGEVDDFFADRLQPGDRFLLEGRCLEFQRLEKRTLLVEEVMGRPLAPHWLGAGWPMSAELARRLFHFRLEAAEALREGPEMLADLLRGDYNLGDDAVRELADLFLHQETVSEIPQSGTLLVEIVAGDRNHDYYLHTPLHHSANDALARVLCLRLEQTHHVSVTSLAADLGLLMCVHSSHPISAQEWRNFLTPTHFDEDLDRTLYDCPALRERFGRVATTGFMVLRNPQGGRRKVGGRDWAQRRLFDQVRAAEPGFVLLRQAEQELREEVCDVKAAQEFLQMLPTWQIHCRNLAEVSPLAESWTQTTFAAVASPGL